jgi:hypothetical protein
VPGGGGVPGEYRKVDVQLTGKGNSNAHGARPVHLIMSIVKWICELVFEAHRLVYHSAEEPRKPLCGGIPSPFLEPSPRSWSHFVGVYRQILTTSLKN